MCFGRIVRSVAERPRSILRSFPGRLVTWLRTAIQRRRSSLGWDPREPAFLGLAMILLFASIVAPWWGSSKVTFDARYTITRAETIQFTPWLTTHWYSSVSGNARSSFFVLQANPILWWDLPREFPTYAHYLPISAALCGLWSAAFLIGVISVWTRGTPRRRFGGWPTIGEATIAGLVGVAIFVSSVEFPAIGGYASFSGVSANGTFQWGPGLGWYFAFGALVLAAFAAVFGFLVDRKLVGICWFCFRPAPEARCTYCGSVQRRPRSESERGASAAGTLAAPKQK